MRFLGDWRLWFSIALVGLVALSGFYVMNAVESRDEALRTAREIAVSQRDQREAATRRIDQLSDQVDELNGQLRQANDAVNRLESQVADLHAQVVSLGGDPVVEQVVVRGRSGRSADSSSFSTNSEPAPPQDTCENRNPQGKCTDADPKGK